MRSSVKLKVFFIVLLFIQSSLMYGQLGIDINYSRLINNSYNSYLNSNSTTEIRTFSANSFATHVGAIYKFKNKIQVELGVGYSENKYKFNPDDKFIAWPWRSRGGVHQYSPKYDYVKPLKVIIGGISVPLVVKFPIKQNEKYTVFAVFGLNYTFQRKIVRTKNDSTSFTYNKTEYTHNYKNSYMPYNRTYQNSLFKYISGLEMQYKLSPKCSILSQISLKFSEQNDFNFGVSEILYSSNVGIVNNNSYEILFSKSNNIAFTLGLVYFTQKTFQKEKLE